MTRETETKRFGWLEVNCDRRILLLVLMLMGVGVSLVASSSSFFAGGLFSDHFALLRRHVIKVVVALAVLIAAMLIDYRVYRRLAPVLFGLSLVALMGLFVFGQTIRNTARWYYFHNLSIQPSDIARVSLVFFLAYWITKVGPEFKNFRNGFAPAAVAIAMVVGLIAMTPNYGTATATVAIALTMLYAGGARIMHILGFIGIGVGVASIRVASTPYVRERITAFLDPSSVVTGGNWQVHQSLIGLGSGGILGVGFGGSQQKMSWLPDSYTDFIFSILGEEAGMVGTLLVSGLFLVIALRALKISRRCGDVFGEMLALGIGASIFVYAALNMYVATGLFPVTGLPLPFISYGGSALVVNAFSVGVLLNISSRVGQPESDYQRARGTRKKKRVTRTWA